MEEDLDPRLQEFRSAGVEAGRYLEQQGRGRPILPREHGRHRRLLRKFGPDRRPEQRSKIRWVEKAVKPPCGRERARSRKASCHHFPAVGLRPRERRRSRLHFQRFEIAGCTLAQARAAATRREIAGCE
jgi:hypothetical protein